MSAHRLIRSLLVCCSLLASPAFASATAQDALSATEIPAQAQPPSSPTQPSLPITLISAQPGDEISTYHWRITRPHACGLHFGWFTDDLGEIDTYVGETTPEPQTGPVDLKLTVERREGFFLLIQEFPGHNAARREHRIELPDQCALREKHLSDPVVLTNARYQTVWRTGIIYVHKHGTERKFTAQFVVRASRADDPSDSFGPPFDPLPVPSNYPFVVTGRITDGQGQGLYGVTITAHTGIATLLGGSEAVTDGEGQYRLRFGPGYRFMEKELYPLGIGIQAALIRVRKPGFREANDCRQGMLAMAETPPDPAWLKKTNHVGVVLPNQPYQLDFVLLSSKEEP